VQAAAEIDRAGMSGRIFRDVKWSDLT